MPIRFSSYEELHPCGAAGGLRLVHRLSAGTIKFDSPTDPVSMLEVLERCELCEPDLRVLPVVEPGRPDAVERGFPPEVPKTPLRARLVTRNRPAWRRLRTQRLSEPTPVSSVA
jgi:hypothetical protein